MTGKVPGKCECGGEIVRDSGAYQCLSCGKDWVTNQEKHQFVESHKDDILASVRKLGYKNARKAWAVPSATWTQILKRWADSATPGSRVSSKVKPSLDGKVLFSIMSTDMPILTPVDQDEVYKVIGLVSVARVKKLAKEV